MTGSLFSLLGTQYINVEHIHLVEERERQLPKDRRPRIQQGFAASVFLPLFLFSANFWLQMTFRGEQTHFIGGPGACRPATGRQDPCRPMVGRQGACRPVAGRQAPPRTPPTFRCFWPWQFCKKHPVARPLGDRTLVAQWPGDRCPFL